MCGGRVKRRERKGKEETGERKGRRGEGGERKRSM